MSFLQAPMKKSQNVDVIKPLSRYIEINLAKDILNDNKDALAEFSQLRSNAVVRSLDKHETSLEVLQRYYDQLCAMEAKLPVSEDQVRISFTWYDAFDKGGLFGVAKYSMNSIGYEKCCVLFNIASLSSQLAKAQNISADDGLKTAAKYFQQASGIYSYLKDNTYPLLQTLPTPDLSVDCLSALSAIMLAEAQDCFYQKAVADNMKDALTAKLAAQAGDLYQDATRQAASSLVKTMWDKDWLPTLSARHSYFAGLAEYHQGLVAKGSGSYGEAVARLQKADRLMAAATKAGGSVVDCKASADKVSRAFAEAKKDNDFIYLDRVPQPEALAAVGRAAIAKATPLPTHFSSNFKDLFVNIVPMAVHQAMATYDSKKGEIINREVGRLREATNLLNGTLASLNLPAALEDLSGDKVPQSVLDKATEIRNQGGTDHLDQMMQDLPELLQRNREILDESLRLMDEEQEEDRKMKERFKEKWNRTPSAKLTEQLRGELAKYRSILDNAIHADAIVKEQYNKNRRGLDLLCKSDSEIAASLPKSSAHASSGGSGVVAELRQLMTTVDAVKKERERIETEFQSATTDISSKFLSALAAEGVINAEAISNTTVEDVYGPLQLQASNNLEEQEQLLAQIQEANQRFLAQTGGAGERDQMLKELAAAYDAYTELTRNLGEGTKFYNDLTDILLKYQNKVSDLVFARRTEKEDLSKDIQRELSKSTGAPTPQVPSHYQDQRGRPDRPPPPQAPPQAPPSQTAPPSQPPPSQSGGGAGSAPQNPYAGGPYYPTAAAPYPTNPYFMPQPGQYAPPSYGSAPYGGQPQYQGYPPQMPYGYQGYGPPGSGPVGYGGYPQQGGPYGYQQPRQ